MLLSVFCLSVMYIGPNSRTERPKKTKIAKNVFINQERKSEVRRRSDTVVVLTIDDANWRFSGVVPVVF